MTTELKTKNQMNLADVANNLAKYELPDAYVNKPVMVGGLGETIFVSEGRMDLHGGTPYFTVSQFGDSQNSFYVERQYMSWADFDNSIKSFIEDFC